jgi:hypothetical protein
LPYTPYKLYENGNGEWAINVCCENNYKTKIKTSAVPDTCTTCYKYFQQWQLWFENLK